MVSRANLSHAVNMDIEERKRAEVAMALSERQLEIILSRIADGITVLDRNGRLIFANERAARLCGFESVQDMFRSANGSLLDRYEMFDEAGAPFPAAKIPSLAALRGETPETDLVIRFHDKKTGHEAWSMVSGVAIPNEHGEIELAATIFRDYTEQRRSQDVTAFVADAATLLGSTLDYQATLSHLTALAVPRICDWCSVDLLSDDGRISQIAVAHKDPEKVKTAKEFNRRFPADLKMNGGSGAVLRTGVTRYLPSVSESQIDAATQDPELRAYLRNIGFTSYLCVPLKIRGKNGDRILGAITFVTAESRRQIGRTEVLLAEELANRAALAIENSRLFHQSEEINRVKDEFLATLSHELRTPLNVIQGHAELLKMDAADRPDLNESIDAIGRNSRAQAQIINDLLDISAIVSGKLSFSPWPQDPKPLIAAAVESARLSARTKDIEIVEWSDASPATVSADPTRFQQIIWNLLSNAVKFTPKGGRIELRSHVNRGFFILEVQDSGIGIDSAFLPHVFERFRQADGSTSRHYGGLGLGLSIVRHLVELHHGSVQVASPGKNQGTTFTVRLPLIPQPEPQARTAPELSSDSARA